jgi:hypothetical protein
VTPLFFHWSSLLGGLLFWYLTSICFRKRLGVNYMGGDHTKGRVNTLLPKEGKYFSLPVSEDSEYFLGAKLHSEAPGTVGQGCLMLAEVPI